MKKPLQRVLAVLGVILLLGLVILTLILAIIGSPYFLASLFMMIVVPILIYGYMIVYKAIAKDKKTEDDEK